YGDYITRVDRTGHATPFVTSGLRGPVGIAVERDSGDLFVANCGGNTIVGVSPPGAGGPFPQEPAFQCPNIPAFDASGLLYAVNFRDNRMFRIDRSGTVTPFATVSDKGLGHLCFKKDRFYVAAFASHAIYEVKLDGKVRRLLGNGQRGVVN